MTTSSTPESNPAAGSALISGAVKAVLIAVAALGVLPLDGEAIAAVTLAVAALVDVGIYFGILKPKVNQLRQQAAAASADNPPRPYGGSPDGRATDRGW